MMCGLVDVDVMDDCEDSESLAVASATPESRKAGPIVGQCPDVNSTAPRIPPTLLCDCRPFCISGFRERALRFFVAPGSSSGPLGVSLAFRKQKNMHFALFGVPVGSMWGY